eukprot:7254804-Lingulodinium_polyedra.AAC.1
MAQTAPPKPLHLERPQGCITREAGSEHSERQDADSDQGRQGCHQPMHRDRIRPAHPERRCHIAQPVHRRLHKGRVGAREKSLSPQAPGGLDRRS